MFNSLLSKQVVYFYTSKKLDVSNKDLSLSAIYTVVLIKPPLRAVRITLFVLVQGESTRRVIPVGLC